MRQILATKNPRLRATLALMGIILLCIPIVGGECPKGDPGPMGPEGQEGPPGDDGDDGAQGPIGWLYWEGEYSPSTTYTPGDAVQSNGSCYVCITQTTGHAPPNATYWDLVAQRGEGEGLSEPVTFQQIATFNGGADFTSGTSVDFTGSNVSGLPPSEWNGGPVSNLTTFNGGANFQGTVDFTGSTVEGLPPAVWNGGTVTNPVQIGEASAGDNLDVYGDIAIRGTDGGNRGGFRNRGDVYSGGNGKNGELVIHDSAGTPVAYLDANVNLVMNNPSGDAELEMYDHGTRTIYLDSAGRCEILQDLDLDGTLRVGRTGNANLEVSWAADIGQDLEVHGNLDVYGNKNFIQPHPTNPSKQIRFTAFEGPESGIYFRGSGQLVEGTAEVEVPEEFRLTAEDTELNVQITLRDPANGVYVESVSLDKIVVKELANGRSDAQFDFFVSGIRKGFLEHETITENTCFRPENAGEAVSFGERYTDDSSANKAVKAILIENGTLTLNGELNLTLAQELGWLTKDEAEMLASQRASDDMIVAASR